MLVYICDGLNEETDLGQGGNCDSDISDNMKSCLSQLLIGAWAIGGSVCTYILLDPSLILISCTGICIP